MNMKGIITQSNYIPWKGYFDSISMVDVFVVYDDMQYTKRIISLILNKTTQNQNLLKKFIHGLKRCI